MKKFFAFSLILAAVSTSAFASTKYSCLPMGDDDRQDDITLTVVSATEVKVDDTFADLDKTYNPRLNTGFKRFEYRQSDEGISEVLVSESLLKGAKTGFIKIQNRGEGFDSQKMHCERQ